MKVFNVIFHQLNYSIFIPRKDQCDTCISAKHGNIDEVSYDAHIKDKDEARAEKVEDKENAGLKKSVWTIDVRAVLLLPKTKASALYYKTKLHCTPDKNACQSANMLQFLYFSSCFYKISHKHRTCHSYKSYVFRIATFLAGK